jgi:hypothetical protein
VAFRDLRPPAGVPTRGRELHQLSQDARAARRAGRLIHCCADHSQYDPARGAQVLSGPAQQPLCAVLLQHDPQADTLTAYGTLGGELFDEFFRKYEMKLSLDVAARSAKRVAARPWCGSWSSTARTRPVLRKPGPRSELGQPVQRRAQVSSFLAKQKRTTRWSKPLP